jgi:hypothetical protein
MGQPNDNRFYRAKDKANQLPLCQRRSGREFVSLIGIVGREEYVLLILSAHII